MNICTCGGNSKLILDNYIINTRIPGYRQIVIKNVRYRQCKICGRMELTDSSQKMIDQLREYYLNQYYEKNNYHTQEYNLDSTSQKVKDFFKLFRL